MRVLFSFLVLCCCVSVGWGQSITAGSATTFCAGGSVVLTVTGGTGITAYQWIKDGVYIPLATNNSYTANATGVYKVKVTDGPQPGDTSILAPVTVTVNPLPNTPVFSFTTNNQCASVPFNFVVTTPQAGVTYTWDFGDGVNNVSGSSVSHLFNDNNALGNGTHSYSVTVVATSLGCVNQASQTVSVKQKPDAKLGPASLISTYNGQEYFSKCSGAASESFTFTNLSTTPSANSSFQISWGDATPDFSSNSFVSTSHVYNVGTNLLQLSIIGNNGCQARKEYKVFVGSNPAVGLGNPGNTNICTGTSLTFPISSTGSNNLGTTYLVTFNDGSASIPYNHPPPASVTHTFDTVSCGTNSGTYNNSFSASIQASNPCQTSSATVVPIYVSEKPRTLFSVSPKDTVCQNTSVTFTNTSAGNNYVKNGVCTQGNAIWSITPSTGWSIVSGTLGNTFDDEDPSIWTSGSNVLVLSFSQTGQFDVKLKSGNPNCGKDSIVKTICVNTLPVANFTIDQSAGCAPLNVNTTNTVTPNTCGNNTYRWAVTYASTAGCLPDTANFIYTGGTSASSINPKFQFNSPGIYTISLTAVAPGGSCSSVPVTQTVTVKGKPIVSIPAIAAVCQGQPVSPTATVNCNITAATCAWSFPGAIPSTSNTASPGNILFSTTGAANISLSVTNECGTTSDTRVVTVTPTPVISAGRDTAVCVNQQVSIAAFSTSPSGATFTWTNSTPSIGLPSSGTGNIPVFTATGSGTATIIVTPSLNGCAGIPDTFIITVSPVPAAPAVRNIDYCQGAPAVPLTATATGSNTLNWYTAASGGTPLATAPTPVTTTATTLTYWVSQVAAGGCESVRASIDVTINPIPSISGVASNPTACATANGSITLSGLTTGQTYTGSYVYNGNPPTNFTQQASGGTIVLNSLASGAYSNITVTLSGCPSAPIGPFNLSDPSAPAAPTASAITPRCSGQTLNLNASGAPAGGTYNWSGPSGFSSNQQNPTIPQATTAATGSYTVSVTVSGCTSPAATVSVVIDSTPAKPLLRANDPLCTDSTLVLTASTNSTMAVSWAWTGPSFTSSLQNPTINNATAANAGVYTATVTATSSSCSSSETITVVINPSPKITGSSSTNPTQCSTPTGSITLNGLISGNSYTVHYTINGTAQTATVTAAANSVVLGSLSAGVYTDVYVELAGCPSNRVGPFTLVDPTPPATPVLVASPAVCSGAAIQLSITGPVAGTTYNFSGPNGFAQSSTASTATISNASLGASGTYRVTATVSGCTSAEASAAVVVNATPGAPVVSTPIVYCQLSPAVALTATPGSSSILKWYTAATGGTASFTAPVPSTASVGTLTYYVSQTSLEGCESERAFIDVTINETPVVTNAAATICSGASFNINATGTGLNSTSTFTWGLPVVTGGITGGSAATNATVIAGTLSNPTDQVQTATYTITPTTGNCPGNSFTLVVTVNPAPRVDFSIGDQNICSGASSVLVSLSSTTAGATINWSTLAPPPAQLTGVTTSGTNSIPVQQLVNLTTQSLDVLYKAVALTSGTTGCPGDTATYRITVNPKPFVRDTAISVCSGSAFSFTPDASVIQNIIPAGTQYQWTVSANAFVTGQQAQATPQASIDQTLANSTNTAQQLVYTITPISAASGNCNGNPFTLTVTVNPTPDISASPATQTICSGNNASISVSSSVAGTTFSWTVSSPAEVTGALNGNGNTINQALTNSSTIPQTVTYTIRSSNSSGGVQCDGASTTVTVIVNPTAIVSNTPLSQSVCTDGPSTEVVWTSLTPGATYSWTATGTTGITGFTASGTGPLPVMTLRNPGDASLPLTYSVTTTLASCPGAAVDYVINVRPDAKARFTYTADTACWPFALAIQNTSPATAVGSYNWYANGNEIGTSTAFPGYTIPGPGDSVQIKLFAGSLYGCKNDSTAHWFYTKPKPAPVFALSRRSGCGPLQVSFTNNTPLLDSFTYRWNFGNGATSSSTQAGAVTFQSSPNFVDTIYYISLTASNECTSVTYTDSVVVFPSPKARLGVPTTAGCSPFDLPITNTSLGGPSTYYWDFGNGDKDTTYATGVLNYRYFTNIVDTFTLMLIAENQCGRDTQLIDIRVAPNSIRPQVSVNASELFGCVAHTVNFINGSAGATTFTWNFDDGTAPLVTNNIQFNVPHTFNSAGTFNVRIDMTNGCSDSFITKQIIVYPKPVAAFAVAPLYCLGDTIRVVNASANATNYRWFWGDGQSVGGFEPTHLYSVAGTYNILLRAEQTNSGGLVCYDTVTHPVNILVQPDASIQTNIAAANCAPFTFNGTATGIINEIVTWYINDTTVNPSMIISNGIGTQYTFNHPGTFTIKMVAVNAAGCRDSSTRTVTVRGTPVAGFTPLNVSVCVRDTTMSYLNTTTFNDFGPLTYRWLVDGVQYATTGNFTHRYVTPPNIALPNTFTTQLIATNAVGCSDTATGLVQMIPNPKAAFNVINPNDCVPYVPVINNSSQNATSYQWFLNGVRVDTNRIPSITIALPSTAYTIRLIVSNNYNCKPDTANFSFVSRIKPRAAFRLNDTLGCTGILNVVTINNTTDARTYQWDWGDATPGSPFFDPTHLYSTLGQYRITLIASDGVCNDTISQLVSVANKPVVDFSASNLRTCDTARIQFTNLTTNADSYLWTFGNGLTSTDVDPYQPLAPSNTPYTVKLVASNVFGCKDSLIEANLITVIVPPYADFFISPSPVISIPNYSFDFINTTTENVNYTYQWNLGDGTIGSTRDISRKFADTGSYPIRLIVFDNTTGCPDTLIKVARIEGQPGYLYVPNAFYPTSLQNQFRSFKPTGKGLASYQFQVFDAWGKLLFQSNELDAAGSPVAGWDGTFKGNPMPQDAYAWRIVAKFRNGRQWEGMSYGNNNNSTPGHTFGTVTLFR